MGFRNFKLFSEEAKAAAPVMEKLARTGAFWVEAQDPHEPVFLLQITLDSIPPFQHNLHLPVSGNTAPALVYLNFDHYTASFFVPAAILTAADIFCRLPLCLSGRTDTALPLHDCGIVMISSSVVQPFLTKQVIILKPFLQRTALHAKPCRNLIQASGSGIALLHCVDFRFRTDC